MNGTRNVLAAIKHWAQNLVYTRTPSVGGYERDVESGPRTPADLDASTTCWETVNEKQMLAPTVRKVSGESLTY